MTSLRFDLGPTSKPLNPSPLWFIEWSEFENHEYWSKNHIY